MKELLGAGFKEAVCWLRRTLLETNFTLMDTVNEVMMSYGF